MTFAKPWLFLLLIPFGLLYYFWKERKFIGYSSLLHLKHGLQDSGNTVLRFWKYTFFGAIFFIIVALASPQTGYYEEHMTLRGREILLCIDTSFSMTGTAIEKIKKIVADFIDKRPGDLMGISIFGTDSALITMPTMEKKLLKKSLERIHASQIGYHTGIGEGLFTSTAALFEKEMGKKFTISELRNSINKEYLGDYALSFVKEMKRRDVLKNKLIILFTDGIYTVGMSPVRPLRLLKRMGIKVYVVAVEASDVTGLPPDVAKRHKEILRNGVKSTGGEYYHAENYDEVAEFYDEINRIEKDNLVIKNVSTKKDLYIYPTIAGLFFLLTSVFVENMWLKIP